METGKPLNTQATTGLPPDKRFPLQKKNPFPKSSHKSSQWAKDKEETA